MIITIDLYADVLFLINFFMDGLILSLTGKLMKYPRSWKKIAFGSALGAIWAVFVSAFPIFPPLAEAAVTYGGISVLMVTAAFGRKRGKEFFLCLGALYIIAFVMAGCFQLLLYHTRAGTYIFMALLGEAFARWSLTALILLGTGSYLGLSAGLRMLWNRKKRKNCLYQVTLFYRGREKKVTALLDTGNRLFEPVSRRPVHVVTYEAVKEICVSVPAVTYIPFGSVGRERGILPGIELDSMEVSQENRESTRIEHPLIGVCRQPLCGNREYEMLLNGEHIP